MERSIPRCLLFLKLFSRYFAVRLSGVSRRRFQPFSRLFVLRPSGVTASSCFLAILCRVQQAPLLPVSFLPEYLPVLPPCYALLIIANIYFVLLFTVSTVPVTEKKISNIGPTNLRGVIDIENKLSPLKSNDTKASTRSSEDKLRKQDREKRRQDMEKRKEERKQDLERRRREREKEKQRQLKI